MSVHANLVTPRNGEIVVAATQDFITGAYLMSKQGLFMTRDQFARITSYMADAAEQHVERAAQATFGASARVTEPISRDVTDRPSSAGDPETGRVVDWEAIDFGPLAPVAPFACARERRGQK
eukprot:scaffold166949_cov32-Tisochrysis_lutea.AAC.8